MRKAIIIASLVGSGLMILDSLNVGSAIAGFLLGGVIPYTNYVITPDQTLALIFFISGFFMSRAVVAIAVRVPAHLFDKHQDA